MLVYFYAFTRSHIPEKHVILTAVRMSDLAHHKVVPDKHCVLIEEGITSKVVMNSLSKFFVAFIPRKYFISCTK